MSAKLKDQMSAQEFRDYLAAKEKGKNSKFGAVATEINGEKYDSELEASFHQDLLVLQRVGEVAKIERSVRYELVVNGVFVCAYELDFRITYTEKYPQFEKYRETGGIRYVDCKSTATVTQLYRVKKQLMLACHGIQLEEVYAPLIKK